MTKSIDPIEGSASSERRLSPRRPLALRVSLYYDGLGLISCKTRDLGFQGALLDTGRVSLNSGARVELVMSDASAHHDDPIKIQASVCRVNNNFAALNFLNLEVSSYRRLKNILARNSTNH